MKKLLTITLLFFTLSNIFTQEIDTIYYDSNWKGVPLKALAAYMRIVYKAPKGSLYNDVLKDYYITGELQGEGDFPIYIDRYDDSKSKWKGKFTTYYKNGKKHGEIFFNDSSQSHGNQYEYYDNGKLKLSANTNNGLLEGENKQFYENGNTEAISVYNNGKIQNGITYWENGNIKSKSQYLNEKQNGVNYIYFEDGSGGFEVEMLDGEYKNDYVTYVSKDGIRTKYDKDLKNVIQDAPNLSDIKSTVLNGSTFLFYDMNGVFIAVNMEITRELNNKYYVASIFLSNNSINSFIFEADKVTAYVSNKNKTLNCEVYNSDEYSNLVGKKIKSRSFWNALGESMAAASAGVSTSSTNVASTGFTNSGAVAVDNHGRAVAGLASSYGEAETSSQTKSYSGAAQYQANQVAQQNISSYNNQLEQYKQALDEGYLKSNSIESWQSITGNINIKYQKGETLILYIPVKGINYPFEWTLVD